MFSLINFLQLLVLLPMMVWPFPTKMLNFIIELDIALFSMDWIPVGKIPFVKALQSWLSFPQKDEYLKRVEVGDGSTFVNHIPTFLFVLGIALLHPIIALVYNCQKEKDPDSVARKIFNSLFTLMSFNIYIRVILEGFLYFVMSTISEISQFDGSTSQKKASLVMALLGSGLMILFFIV